MKTLLLLIISLMLFALSWMQISRISSTTKPLNYVIYENRVSGDSTDEVYSRREMKILMDESSFSESNLRVLYDKISSKYPSPINLFVSIETSFDQIKPPDTPFMSDQPDDPLYYEHHYASFRRVRTSNATIRYSVNPRRQEEKTITIVK